MANTQYSKYSQGINLEDYSGSFSTDGGTIYLSSSYMNFKSHLDINSKNIVNVADPSNAQDAATKAYVDAQLTAQDLDFSTDSGTGAVDLDSETMAFAGSSGLDVTHSGQTITFALDVNEVSAATTVADGDAVLIYDADAGAHKKMTRANFIESAALDSINIDGGAIDGTVIGANSAVAGTFAALVGTTATFSSTLTANGDVDLGNATSDTVTVTGRFDSDLLPSSDSARDLGSSALQWAEAHIDTGHIDTVTATNVDGILGANTAAAATVTTLTLTSMGGNWTNASRTVADMGTVTTMDLNGGSIDGTTIGAASQAAGTFTNVSGSGNAEFAGTLDVYSSTALTGELHCHSTLEVDSTSTFTGISTFAAAIDANSTSNFQGAMVLQSTLTGSGAATLASLHCDSVNLDGGNIDGVTIGSATPAAGDFTTLEATSTLTVDGLATFNGNVDLGNATSDTITTTARFDSDLVPSTDSARDLGTSALQWAEVHADAGYIDAITVTGTSTLTTVDINGGAIDGAVIGANSAAAGTFAALVGTSLSVSEGNITNVGTLEVDTVQSDADGTGLNINFDGNTGTNKLSLTDNLASALDVTQGANSYLKFVTTDGSEHVMVGKKIELDGDLELESDHDVTARSFITYSDVALKENIETVTNAMDMIQGLRGVSYDLKDSGNREFGFIAQEVNTVVPEVVHTSGDMMGIDYTRITSLLVEAVKTQQAEIEALKNLLDK